MKHLNKKQLVDIINSYTTELVPMIALAKKYNVSRQAIYKILKRANVDTSKQAANITVSCTACGAEVVRKRCCIRQRKHIFCCRKCYTAYLNAGGTYVPNRTGSRRARKMISEIFDLQPEHIVHHIDKNQFNNDLTNLMVFKNQGDHIRFHRGFDVNPIFPY